MIHVWGKTCLFPFLCSKYRKLFYAPPSFMSNNGIAIMQYNILKFSSSRRLIKIPNYLLSWKGLILLAIDAELEQGEALRYLYRWLQNHPKYGGLVPPQSTDSPYGPDVSTRLHATLSVYVSVYSFNLLHSGIFRFQMGIKIRCF